MIIDKYVLVDLSYSSIKFEIVWRERKGIKLSNVGYHLLLNLYKDIDLKKCYNWCRE